MLQDFPAETAVVRVKKKAPELVGFDPEPSKLARRATAVVGDLQKFRTELPGHAIHVAGSVFTMFVAAAIAVAFVASWRPSPADALSRTSSAVRSSNIALPAEPIPLPAAPITLAPRVDRKAAIAIATSVRPRVRPSVAARPGPVERPQVAELAPVVAVVKVDTAPTAPRREIELPAEPPQVNIAPVRTVLVDETSAIQNVIRRYESAYERLDAAAAKEIWPSLDERALANAFAGLSSQTLTLQPCRVDVTSSSAVALCSGYATYVGRVGNRAGQIQRRTWRFQLRKSGESWQIGSVQSN